MAIVHMIYDEVILVLNMVYCNYICLVLTVSLCQVILQHFEATVGNHLMSHK